jgi:PEGA domain-containing protein
MRVMTSREPNRTELMRKPFFAMIVAGAIALGSPNAVLAAGRTRGGGGHAVERVAARPFVGHGFVYGRVRPYGYDVVPRFGFAYDPFWYGPGWGYYGYPYLDVVPSENSGGLRLDITPKTAQVFVDGTYAGVVDDFNGHFQHLDLTPGGHRIDVRQPGFQPLTFQVYIQPGHTTDYKAALVPAPVA